MPSIEVIGRGVLITAVSLVIINLVKPYLPAAGCRPSLVQLKAHIMAN